MAFHPNYAKNRRFYVNYTDTERRHARRRVPLGRAPSAARHGAGAAVRRTSRLEPQRRPAPVRARRQALRRHGRRRRRAATPEPRADASIAPREAAADRHPLAVDWADGGLRPAQPLALLVRPQDGRPLHRRRRPERARGDRLPATSGAPPANFGWDSYEGSRSSRRRRRSTPPAPLVFPILEYGHDDGCSVTGGYVYRGAAVPAAVGRYFYGDYCIGQRVEPEGRRTARRPASDARASAWPSLSSFGEDARGELYFVVTRGHDLPARPLERSSSDFTTFASGPRVASSRSSAPGPASSGSSRRADSEVGRRDPRERLRRGRERADARARRSQSSQRAFATGSGRR